jgi:hypothetical protein
MRTRDNVETDTRVVDAPDVTREAAVPPQRVVLDDPEKRREASAESQQQVDGTGTSSKFEVNRDELGRFDLKRAGLPDMSIEAAAKYVDEHRNARPWLAMTDGASPEARRIIAALDAAGGHAHIRHEGWVSEDANRRRVACHEDPAQLDPAKKSLGIDGLRPDNSPHNCRTTATRITDPDAFATAFVRGVQHPKVQDALNMSFNPVDRPDQVAIPIAELLGSDGHRNCSGWRLEPGGGSMKDAVGKRDAWVEERSKGCTPDGPEPRTVPVRSFKDGDIVFDFMRNNDEQRYEVVTMFARPAQPKPAGNKSGLG